MLMQNFKSAADLEITERQLDALRKTLVLLETERLEYVPLSEIKEAINFAPAFSFKFNMRHWQAEGEDCGTICCIGGTAELIAGAPIFSWHLSFRLSDLFMPREINRRDWHGITPSQAATALRSYLTTGDARWDLAVA